jgi:hypothetical protein
MFISGELFQQKCKWNIDNRYPIRKWSLFLEIKKGDRIFMKLNDIPSFLSIAKSILVPLDIVIHNSDESFTQEMFNMLKPHSRRIYAVNCLTPYAISLPLGFRDHQYTSHHTLKSVIAEPDVERSIKCLVNFLISTNPSIRQPVFDFFKDKSFCTVQDYTSYDYQKSLSHSDSETMQRRIDFYRTLKRTKFAICPQGTGMDTHRVYECIVLGVIPIVLSSPLNELYSKFPIWIVNSWEEVTESSLDSCTIHPNPASIINFNISW